MSSGSPLRPFGSATPGSSTAALVAVCAYAVVATGALWSVATLPTAVRIPLALPLLLFAPGYAIVTALFPVGKPPNESTPGGSERETEAGVCSEAPEPLAADERWTLALLTSIAVVPAVALVANAVTGVRAGPVLLGTTLVTVAAAVVAVVRLPIGGARSEAGGHGVGLSDVGLSAVPTDAVTIVAVTATVLLLVASVAVPFVGGASERPRTEFYLTNGNGNGAIPTDDADADGGGDGGLANGTTGEYDLRIQHHADDDRRYSVVVLMDPAGDRPPRELHRDSTSVAPGETATITYDATGLEQAGTLRFLLFRGDPPPDPDRQTAHRTLEIELDATA